MPTSRAPLKVFLDARMSEWSGIGRYTKGLARALTRREDLALTLVTAAHAPAVVEAGIAAHPVTVLPAHAAPLSLAGARELTRLIASVEPDVVHCPHIPLPLPATHPLVVTLHDLTPLLVNGVMPNAVKRAVYRRLNGRAVRVADAIVVPSEHTATDIATLFPRAAGKTHVTVEAADDFSAGPVGEIPHGLVEPGQRYIFTMGNTKPHKDLPTLFSAFAQLAGDMPDLALLLAGEGDPAYLFAHVPRACRSRVRFTGRVTDDELRALYAGAVAFAFPSTYEGFGLPPLEAMALGTPVVTTSAASLPEVVGEAALVVAPGDVDGFASALRRVASESALRDDLIARGAQRAAQFTWDSTAAETVAVYRSVLEASS